MIVALDIGSTNSRAWLLDGAESTGSGQPVVRARATAAIGVRDSAIAGTTTPVRETVIRLIAELSKTGKPSAVVGAGMVTSTLGLREVPHVVAPAALSDLASGVDVVADASLCEQPILLIPGVRTAGTDVLSSDVMRGEETLAVGLLRVGLITPGVGVLNAGSHWKLIRVDAKSRIAGSRTSLGGEVVHAVTSTTLLKEALPSGPMTVIHDAWLDRGVEASASSGLLRAMFVVRLLHQQGVTTPEQRQSFLAGAAIGADVDAMMAAGMLSATETIVVTGSAAMPEAWARVLRSCGMQARALSAAEVEQGFLSGVCAVAAAWREMR